MVIIKNSSVDISSRTAYHLVRRAQSKITTYRNFHTGDLAQYLGRDAFIQIADRLTTHYFQRSQGLMIFDQVKDLYLAHLVLAPILQRLPLSFKFDWHRGHLLSFLRVQSGGRIGRHHIGIRYIENTYSPDLLAANMAALGIYDADMLVVVQDIYRRHAGGKTLKDLLAHQLFNPLLMLTERKGFELRIGNQFIRMEKAPFDGSIDIQRGNLTLLDFQVRSVEHRGRRALEICISDDSVRQFQAKVEAVIKCRSEPSYKLQVIDHLLRDFVERTRSARSGLEQMKELKGWLGRMLRHLAATSPVAKELPNRLITSWLQRVDSRLHFKMPNFFFDPYCVPEKTYITFFSPYREV